MENNDIIKKLTQKTTNDEIKWVFNGDSEDIFGYGALFSVDIPITDKKYLSFEYNMYKEPIENYLYIYMEGDTPYSNKPITTTFGIKLKKLGIEILKQLFNENNNKKFLDFFNKVIDKY
jgi:hypothetical protein